MPSRTICYFFPVVYLVDMPGRKQKGIKNDTREVFLDRKRALNFFFFKSSLNPTLTWCSEDWRKAQLRRPIHFTFTITTLKWILPGNHALLPSCVPFLLVYILHLLLSQASSTLSPHHTSALRILLPISKKMKVIQRELHRFLLL